jgi:type I restriction enzyme S subunit
VIATRVGLGKVCLLGQDTAVNQDLRGIVPKSNKVIDVNFLFAWFKSISEQIIAEGTGATVQGVKLPFIKGLAVPFPEMEEQHRIVTLLDEAFADIATAKANAEKNLQNARDLLDQAIQDDLQNAVEKYGTITLGKVCTFENGDRGKNYPGKQHRVEKGIPFINAGHLTPNGLDFNEMDYISPERFALLGNGKIKPNDVLFCLRGSLGKFSCVGNLTQGAIASSLVILRPTQDLNLNYLLMYLSSRQCNDQIESLKGGAAQPNLGAKDLKQFAIPLPGTSIQIEMAIRLSDLKEQIDTVTRIYTGKLTALDDLKKSLLHQAFSGQL